ncbi:uncharacterized protein ASPGLDRAFT_1506007 [Aspergillus glaucus CBS 516.65]|uniref:Uncharacterized protein n=1 Tax=Aspergillus glaucus CBS 516.65 TaxID=1160497 RepID=A0A1L9VVR8_ASPGL|nr:hypothetical protein ASPGLDRAFT_1506007 [Aspergillus glaucus CBS 516.65]OJJ88008.1 hypothetical protein ASPGLDRAFT_1506007 [Aspergillus glaucus CBS 516.65]
MLPCASISSHIDGHLEFLATQKLLEIPFRMPSRNRKVRKHLDFLWDNLVKDGASIVRKDGGVDDNVLDEYNILRVSQFDFENLGSENLFDPMPLDELQKYPVDTSSLLYHFREYKPEKCGKGSSGWAMGSRPNAYDMLEVRDLERLEQPHPFFLNGRAGWHDQYPATYKRSGRPYSGNLFLEIFQEDKQYAHLTISAYQPCNGKEGSILFGELAIIITAMRNRANQLKVGVEYEGEDDEYKFQGRMRKTPLHVRGKSFSV